MAGAWLIQARRFASRSSTRQTTRLNSDKKVNSKPSETGRSPLNRLANRPVVLRKAAHFEPYSFYIFRVFIAPFCFGRRFSCAVLSYCRKNHFSVIFKYDFTPWKRQKSTQNLLQPIHAFSLAYDIIVDVTTTSHFGTFRSHRCPCNAYLIHTQTIYSTVFLTWASQERVGRQINRQPTAPRGFSFAFGKIAWHTPFSRQEPFAA